MKNDEARTAKKNRTESQKIAKQTKKKAQRIKSEQKKNKQATQPPTPPPPRPRPGAAEAEPQPNRARTRKKKQQGPQKTTRCVRRALKTSDRFVFILVRTWCVPYVRQITIGVWSATRRWSSEIGTSRILSSGEGPPSTGAPAGRKSEKNSQ